MESIASNKPNKGILFVIILLIISVLVVLFRVSTADSPTAQIEAPTGLTAVLSEVQGTVLVNGVAAADGQSVSVLDHLLTIGEGQARLTLSNGTIIRISPDTAFTLTNLQDPGNFMTAFIELEYGEVFVILNGGTVLVNTPEGIASVQGSYMGVWRHKHDRSKGTEVHCLEGDCRVTNRSGSHRVRVGKFAKMLKMDLFPIFGLMNQGHIARWLKFTREAHSVMDKYEKAVSELDDEPVVQSKNVACDVPDGWGALLIQPGRNIQSIANQLDMDVEDLLEGNCIDDDHVTLKTGDVIFAPSTSETKTGCTPATGWSFYLTQSGDSVASLALTYAITEAELLTGSCLPEGTILTAGVAVYLPALPTPTNVPPTATQVPPTATKVPATKVPATKVPATKTPTATPVPPTPTPTEALTFLSNALGEKSGSLASCNNTYSIDAEDGDGLAFVRVEYYIADGSSDLPVFDGLTYEDLTQSGDTWSKTFSFSHSVGGGGDVDYLHWRFWVKDAKGNTTYFPGLGAYKVSFNFSCP